MALKKLPAHTRKGHSAAESKKRLVEAGVELFARYSFDGVSTRTLANHAQVNLAAIQYYFGGKEGLYLAVARHIVQTVNGWSKPIQAKIEKELSQGNPGKEESFLLLCELMDHIIEHALGSPESKKWMGIFMREQIEPSDAFDILYEGVMEPFHRSLRSLVSAIMDLEVDATETKLRAYAAAGQVFIFHIARAEISRSMAWQEYGPKELDAVKRVVLEQLRTLFGIPMNTLDSYFASENFKPQRARTSDAD